LSDPITFVVSLSKVEGNNIDGGNVHPSIRQRAFDAVISRKARILFRNQALDPSPSWVPLPTEPSPPPGTLEARFSPVRGFFY